MRLSSLCFLLVFQRDRTHSCFSILLTLDRTARQTHVYRELTGRIQGPCILALVALPLPLLLRCVLGGGSGGVDVGVVSVFEMDSVIDCCVRHNTVKVRVWSRLYLEEGGGDGREGDGGASEDGGDSAPWSTFDATIVLATVSGCKCIKGLLGIQKMKHSRTDLQQACHWSLSHWLSIPSNVETAPKRLLLQHSDDEILSGIDEDVSSIRDGHTVWAISDPATTLERHLLSKGGAKPIYRDVHDRRHFSPQPKCCFDDKVPNHPSERSTGDDCLWCPS